jgi:hypothetical protein
MDCDFCEGAALGGPDSGSDLHHTEKPAQSAAFDCSSLENCDHADVETMKDKMQTQLSPPAKSTDEDCIMIDDSPPITGTDSAKSKRGTARKGAFAGAGSKRSGPSVKSKSPEANGKSQEALQRFLNMVSVLI